MVLRPWLKVPICVDGGLVQRDMVYSRHLRHPAAAAARPLLGDRARQVPGGDEEPSDDGSPLRESKRCVPEQETRGGEYGYVLYPVWCDI